MLVTRIVVAALFSLGSVAALPAADQGPVVVEARAADGDGNPLEARYHGCHKPYYEHEHKCCRFGHFRRRYYDCYSW